MPVCRRFPFRQALAAGCPVGLSFIGWEGGDEALLDLAVKLEPLLGRRASDLRPRSTTFRVANSYGSSEIPEPPPWTMGFDAG